MFRIGAYAFFLALGVVALLWAALPAGCFVAEATDYDRFYRPVAERLAAGKGLTLPTGDPAVRYPPGYPLLLAAALAIGAGVKGATAWNLLSLAASCAAMAMIAAMQFGPRHSWACAAVFLSYPLVLAISKAPGTELPFCAVLHWAMCLLVIGVSGRLPLPASAIGSGILFGVAMLIRPIGIGMPLLAAGFLLFAVPAPWRARVLSTAFVLAAAVLVVLPWEIIVWRATGRLLPLSSGGVPSIRDGLTFACRPDKKYRVAVWLPDDARAVALSVAERNEQLRSVGDLGRHLRDQCCLRPAGVVKLAALKTVRALYATDSGRNDGCVALAQAPYLLLIGVAFGAATVRPRPSRPFAIFTAATLVYFWLMTTLALSIARYMIPAVTLCFALVPAVLPERRSLVQSA